MYYGVFLLFVWTTDCTRFYFYYSRPRYKRRSKQSVCSFFCTSIPFLFLDSCHFVSFYLIGLNDYLHSFAAMGVECLYILVPQSHTPFAAAGANALRENCAMYANVIETRNVEPEK